MPGKTGHSFQTGGGGNLLEFLSGVWFVLPSLFSLLVPSIDKSHIYVSQACTERPSEPSAWAGELGPM